MDALETFQTRTRQKDRTPKDNKSDRRAKALKYQAGTRTRNWARRTLRPPALGIHGADDKCIKVCERECHKKREQKGDRQTATQELCLRGGGAVRSPRGDLSSETWDHAITRACPPGRRRELGLREETQAKRIASERIIWLMKMQAKRQAIQHLKRSKPRTRTEKKGATALPCECDCAPRSQLWSGLRRNRRVCRLLIECSPATNWRGLR